MFSWLLDADGRDRAILGFRRRPIEFGKRQPTCTAFRRKPLFARLEGITHDSLARRGCGEFVDGARHPIALAVALLRANPVVIGRLWREGVESRSEKGVSPAAVLAQGGFCGLPHVRPCLPPVQDSR